MRGFWIGLSILFAIFLTLYISQATGYYDYEQYQKTELTKEKIVQFEEDVKAGKKIKVENYLESIDTDFNNSASRAGLKISDTIQKCVKSGINISLTFFGVLLGE
jgi:L-ribulose-5-phosphate 3-epimerase UlaE